MEGLLTKQLGESFPMSSSATSCGVALRDTAHDVADEDMG